MSAIHHRTVTEADTIALDAAGLATLLPDAPGSDQLNRAINVENCDDVEIRLFGSRDSGGDANNDTCQMRVYTWPAEGRKGWKEFEAAVTFGDEEDESTNPCDSADVDEGRKFKSADTIVPTAAYSGDAKLGFHQMFNATGTPGNEQAAVVVATRGSKYLFVGIDNFSGSLDRVDVMVRRLPRRG